MAEFDNFTNANVIAFPEFTAKLVKSVFDTLVASQIEQLEAFQELTKQVAKGVSGYINDTKDDISGTDILPLVEQLLPGIDPNSTTTDLGAGGLNVSDDDLTAINRQLKKKDEFGNELMKDGSYDGVTLVKDAPMQTDDIIQAFAERIANNKYFILQRMLETGLIRLVVTDGEIETKLNYEVKSFGVAKDEANSLDTKRFGFGGGLGFAKGPFKLRASGSYSKLDVSTTSSTTNTSSLTEQKLAGRVYIHFKSDYKPLGSGV